MRLQSILTTRAESTASGAGHEYFVLGGGHVGTSVARHLRTAGHAVTVVDEAHDPADEPGIRGDPTDHRTLDAAGITDAATVVVAMPQDGLSLLVAQLVRTRFGVTDVRILVRTPDRCDVVADAGHEAICVTTVLSDAVVAKLETLRQPA
ncbi:NAD(P)-binding protein [Haloplanus aerogenes]|uniref:Potassium transporter TrkA n=1 Tax=Haloplanus aerogenes TaxID=660522 RepID=A0A3M0D8M5_9EURY|nr:NAD(P)-binding protein [Haloplanus aerogenes]AZH26940.1 potassium transporter TrkA [Haloplanus aerogenes]RMB12593.1 TrkA family protein [Haloplanus aerogenes]